MKRYKVLWTETHKAYVIARDEDQAIQMTEDLHPDITRQLSEGAEAIEIEQIPDEPDCMDVAHSKMEEAS